MSSNNLTSVHLLFLPSLTIKSLSDIIESDNIRRQFSMKSKQSFFVLSEDIKIAKKTTVVNVTREYLNHYRFFKCFPIICNK